MRPVVGTSDDPHGSLIELRRVFAADYLHRSDTPLASRASDVVVQLELRLDEEYAGVIVHDAIEEELDESPFAPFAVAGERRAACARQFEIPPSIGHVLPQAWRRRQRSARRKTAAAKVVCDRRCPSLALSRQ